MSARISIILLILVSVASGQQEPTLTFSSAGVGLLRFCDPLSRVDSLWARVQDTTIASEEVQWPAKLVRLASGGTILFESSWIDSNHVWRASTDARMVQSPGGVRVGMTMQELMDRGIRPTIELPEGILVLDLGAEGIAISIDSASAARLEYSRDQTIAAVPNAKVERLYAHGSRCDQPQRPN